MHWPFFEIAKNGLLTKSFFVKLIYFISRVFWPGLFFLARSVLSLSSKLIFRSSPRNIGAKNNEDSVYERHKVTGTTLEQLESAERREKERIEIERKKEQARIERERREKERSERDQRREQEKLQKYHEKRELKRKRKEEQQARNEKERDRQEKVLRDQERREFERERREHERQEQERRQEVYEFEDSKSDDLEQLHTMEKNENREDDIIRSVKKYVHNTFEGDLAVVLERTVRCSRTVQFL